MKNLILILFLFVCFLGFSQTIVELDSTSDTIVFGWSAVELDMNNNSIPENTTIEYEIFIYDYNIGIDSIKSIGITGGAGKSLFFPNEGTFVLGVRTIVTNNLGAGFSEIAFSINENDCLNGNSFVIKVQVEKIIIPQKPKHLRITIQG